MEIWIYCICFIAVTVLILSLTGYCSFRRRIVLEDIKSEPVTQIIKPSSEDTMHAGWWKSLDDPDRIKMAILLIEKAMPVWTDYANGNPIEFKNAPSAKPDLIAASLLQDAVFAVKRSAQNSSQNLLAVQNYYNAFVMPVIAMYDGFWAPAYPVKKLFLSVYFTLKAVMEGTVKIEDSYSVIAIVQAIDCLDISKIIEPVEIAKILNLFKDKSTGENNATNQPVVQDNTPGTTANLPVLT